MCKYWEAAKSSLSEFKVSMIRSIEMLEFMSRRQLTAIVCLINKQLGQTIVKSRFGKTYSQMNKKEIVQAIWEVREIQMQAPKGLYIMDEVTERLYVQRCNDVEWVHYFGFKTEAEALIFQRYINQTKGAKLSSLRKAVRLASFGLQWEVKAWQVEESLIGKIKAKYSKKPSQPPVVIPQPLPIQQPPACKEAETAVVGLGDNFGGERIRVRLEAKCDGKYLGRTGTIVNDNPKANYVEISLDNTPIEKGEVVKFFRDDIAGIKDISARDVSIAQRMWDNLKSSVGAEKYRQGLERKGFKVVNDIVCVG